MNSTLLLLILLQLYISHGINFYDVPIDPSKLPDLYCDQTNLQRQFCLVQSNRDSGFKYINPEGTLEFSGVIADVRNGTFCQIYIVAQSVWFEYSNITGCDIFINTSMVLKLQNSALSVEGSINGGPGYTKNSTGNFYSGPGGYCQPALFNSSFFYGDFRSAYDDNTASLGSGGMTSRSAGGGRIVILTDYLYTINSDILADGYPNSQSRCGTENPGTGGYIFINFSSITPSKDNTLISANGGLACGPGMYGGSGGRIIINSTQGPIYRQITARGGVGIENSSCSWGAPGTIYFQNGTLSIQQGQPTNIPTPALLDTTKIPTGLILDISSGATVIPVSVSNPVPIEVASLVMSENASLLSSGSPTQIYDLNITRSRIKMESNSLIASSGNLYFHVKNFTMQNSALLSNNSLIQILSTGYVNFTSSSIGFEPAPSIPYTAIILNSTLSQQLMSSNFNASYIFIAGSYLQIDGEYIATNQTCFSTEFIMRNTMVNPLNFSLDFTAMQNYYEQNDNITDFYLSHVAENHTFFIFAHKHLNFVNGSVNGARIGVFAENMTVGSTFAINSDGLGCPSDLGPGHGAMVELGGEGAGHFCASTGGSHGGYGGIGISISSTTDLTNICVNQAAYLQPIYGNKWNPLNEGSGGGSYNDAKGGAGGGVVFVGVQNKIVLNGNITARGLAAPVDIQENTNSSGGGSGGSIQIYMQFISGHGIISADGGASSGTGGEGSGGRIFIGIPKWYSHEYNSHFADFDYPTISAAPGFRHNVSRNVDPSYYLAQNGSLSTTPCRPGTYGLFCLPCPAGQYKIDFSNSECEPCMEPPIGELSKQIGLSTYQCPIVCTFSSEISGVKQCFSNIFSFSWYHGLEYFFYIMGIIMLMVSCLILSRWGVHSWKLKKQRKRLKTMDLEIVNRKGGKDTKLNEKYFARCHVQRIYLLGDNVPQSKWFTNMDLIKLKEISLIRDKIDSLLKVEEINRNSTWRKSWIFLLKLTAILYFPIYLLLLQVFRKKIYKRVVQDIEATNRELKQLCLLKNIPLYYVNGTFNKDRSCAYLDIYQEEVDRSHQNSKEPLTLMLCGSGTFFSPYIIEKTDLMFKHLLTSWANYNLGPKFDRTDFVETMHEFTDEFNKRAMFINYHASSKTFQAKIQELIHFVNEAAPVLETQFHLFVEFFVCEIPRFTVEETDTTQPFLQSPIQVTILENPESPALLEFLAGIQNVQKYENKHIRFFLLFYSHKSLTSAQDTHKSNRRNSPVLPIEKKVTENEEVVSQDISKLKERLFNKLDELTINVEYSIPQELMKDTKRKNKYDRYEKSSTGTKRFFSKYYDLLRFFMNLKKTSRDRAEIYAIIGVLLALDLFFLWFKIVVVFNLPKYGSFVWAFILIFPFATLIAPFTGIASLITMSPRITVFFAGFNMLAVVNKAVSLIVTSLMSQDEQALYFLFEILSFICSLAIQIYCNSLATVQI